MTRDMLDAMPTGRNIQAVGILIPGTNLSVGGGGAISRDVGGSGGLQQSPLIYRGSGDAVQTMYGRDFSLGHFNQHSRVHGEIRVGDERWPIAGHGWRDHSWGPRYWQAIYYYRLFIANFPNGDGFMLLKITDKNGKARRQGVLLVDGNYEEILDLDVATDWSERQDPSKVRISVMTARRKAQVTAEILMLAPLRNRRKTAEGETLVSRIAEGFTRFTWDGQQGYGMTEYIERIEDGMRSRGFEPLTKKELEAA